MKNSFQRCHDHSNIRNNRKLTINMVTYRETSDKSDGLHVDSSSSLLSLPRLDEDLTSLTDWIETNGGDCNLLNIIVQKTSEGWTITTKNDIGKGSSIMTIPKSICLYSDTNDTESIRVLDSTLNLMSVISPSQWRLRLAIALLSERVRDDSSLKPYLNNLPFEYWALPIFFGADEFEDIQDLTLMQRQRERCNFLLQFCNEILTPLQQSQQDPFSGHAADVNALGWGFASASSRAIRNNVIQCDSKKDTTFEAIMIPYLDIVSHSISPSCYIYDNGDSYQLRSYRDIVNGEELTISYGNLSNDDLFGDYGFSLDKNPHDMVEINADKGLIDAARFVMGQSLKLGHEKIVNDVKILRKEAEHGKLHIIPSISSDGSVDVDSKGNNDGHKNNINENKDRSTLDATVVGIKSNSKLSCHCLIGRGRLYDDRWMHRWQLQWLQALNFHGEYASAVVSFTGTDVSGIDGRMWALLRVLYAAKENDLRDQGYDPELLKKPGSMLSSDIERHVVKTIIGSIAIILCAYETTIRADLLQLRTGIKPQKEIDGTNNLFFTGATNNIVTDARNIIRTALGENPQPTAAISISPTLSRIGLDLANEAQVAAEEELVRREAAKRLVDKENKDNEDNDLFEINNSDSDDVSTVNNGKDHINLKMESMKDEDIFYCDISLLGQTLTVNEREALKYRIRRKRMLMKLIRNLDNLYTRLCESDGSSEPLLPYDENDIRRETMRKYIEQQKEEAKSGASILAKAGQISAEWNRDRMKL